MFRKLKRELETLVNQLYAILVRIGKLVLENVEQNDTSVF